jgi:hypothetical protein
MLLRWRGHDWSTSHKKQLQANTYRLIAAARGVRAGVVVEWNHSCGHSYLPDYFDAAASTPPASARASRCACRGRGS